MLGLSLSPEKGASTPASAMGRNALYSASALPRCARKMKASMDSGRCVGPGALGMNDGLVVTYEDVRSRIKYVNIALNAVLR